MNQPVRTLRRLPQEKKVAGVCAGLARYAGVDQVLVRLGFVLLTVLGGSGLLLYLVAWVIMPKADPHEPFRSPRRRPARPSSVWWGWPSVLPSCSATGLSGRATGCCRCC
ncbi:MAG: PspC domain-containing protein [Acidimicrobiales bacterium]